MKQSKLLALNVAVTLILIFGIVPTVVSKEPKAKEPNLTEQVDANTAAITENKAAIAAEAEARIVDDNIVQGEVAAERAARIADDNYLQNLIEESAGDIGPAKNIPGQACPEGESVIGIDLDGVIHCAPVDGGEPQPYKIIFASLWAGTPAFGGLAAADAMCSLFARTAGLPGTYKAWLSDSTTSAADRLTHAEVPYITPAGDVVAANWADLTDGSLLNQIDITENGGFLTIGAAYTNTTISGEILNSDPTKSCYDWTSTAEDAIAGYGNIRSVDSLWTSWSDVITCDILEDIHLYCVQQ